MLILSTLAFFVSIFLMCSIAVTVAWMGFMKTTAEESDAARRDLESMTGALVEAKSEPEDSPLFRTERLSTLNFWDSLLTRFDFMEILKERIAQAELEWSVGRVTLGMLLAGFISFLILVKIVAVWAALAGSILIGMAPYGYILRLRNKRFQKFRENFPDVLDSLARALRAGYPLSASMEMLAAETLPPVSVEMRKTAAEANLGMGWPRALENLSRRMPLLEVNLFTAAVQLHARTGGKLSEVLGSLSENMREALALQGEVRALAAHGRVTGIILTALPVGIAIMMMIVSPGYMQVLFEYPNGKTLITAAILCLVLAHLVIRKIVDIKV
jgi:tight adherence protein B